MRTPLLLLWCCSESCCSLLLWTVHHHVLCRHFPINTTQHTTHNTPPSPSPSLTYWVCHIIVSSIGLPTLVPIYHRQTNSIVESHSHHNSFIQLATPVSTAFPFVSHQVLLLSYPSRPLSTRHFWRLHTFNSKNKHHHHLLLFSLFLPSISTNARAKSHRRKQKKWNVATASDVVLSVYYLTNMNVLWQLCFLLYGRRLRIHCCG